MELTATTHVGGDKIKRYGWTVQDEPGEMRLLHKDVLQIRPAYQRDLVAQKVSEISAAWSWVALGALDGLWILNSRCGDGLADPRLVKRLREKGGRALQDAANKASAYYASGGAKIWAQGMLAEMNKGLQERRRFTMDGVEA